MHLVYPPEDHQDWTARVTPHQQLSPTHPAATSPVYCENAGENVKLCTFTSKWSISDRKVMKNFRATKTPSIRRTGENGVSVPLKGPLGAWMHKRPAGDITAGLCGNVRNKAGHRFFLCDVNMWGRSMCASANWHETSAIPKPTVAHRNKIKALIGGKYTCLFNSGQVTHTNITGAWMLPRTITNNRLHPLKDFPRRRRFRINTVPCSLPCLQCCGIISGLFVHRGISSRWHGELVGNGHPTSGQLFFNRVGMKRSVWDEATHAKCTHISFMKDTRKM